MGGANRRNINLEKAFIDGIYGVNLTNSSSDPVYIDDKGQLGQTSSSSRYKESIETMNAQSAPIHALRPVSFRYKEAQADGTKPVELGLIAEEVAEVFPELVVYDKQGEPETVKYHVLSSLLLNELQKLTARHDEVANRMAEKDSEIAALQRSNSELQQRFALLEQLSSRLAKREARALSDPQVVQASTGHADG